jgi:hypothetical protein
MYYFRNIFYRIIYKRINFKSPYILREFPVTILNLNKKRDYPMINNELCNTL